tara:strand:+ start:216 stop:698 length:483 start_codon:yes stop_codon:yes gene_type:complete
MTEPIDRMAQSRFVEDDDGYKLVRERHNKMHQAARSARQDILHELRKINMLLMAFDLCVEKAWEHEDIAEDSELDKQLKRLTPDGSELWFGHYNAAAELIKEQMIEQCKTVLMAEHAADKLMKEARSHCDSLSAAREEAEKRYVASLEPAKRGPGRPKKK